MPYFGTSDGASIHYSFDGSGEESLIFKHGGFGSLSHWQPQVNEFAPSYSILRMDLRGHGKSPVPVVEDYSTTINQYADDIAELARYLNLQKATAIGHSMGAAITVALAQQHPDIIKTLV